MSFREELGALGRTAERVARHRTTQVSGTCNECCKSLGDWAWSGWSRVLDVVLETDLLSAMLSLQLVFMLFAGLRVSIVSLGYLFFW